MFDAVTDQLIPFRLKVSTREKEKIPIATASRRALGERADTPIAGIVMWTRTARDHGRDDRFQPLLEGGPGQML